ncbi:hypothetical protein HGRIS_014825 [Hohenbuehelia grisea]|uniref:Uncharacterized protein n=1 Tax=Hohenbuehelia grisea TaxID=104357 RepID=A0ABR3IQZ1_9AGAR
MAASDDDYAPALPPDLATSWAAAGPSQTRIGSAMPIAGAHYADDDSDDNVGPMPLPTGAGHGL